MNEHERKALQEHDRAALFYRLVGDLIRGWGGFGGHSISSFTPGVVQLNGSFSPAQLRQLADACDQADASVAAATEEQSS